MNLIVSNKNLNISNSVKITIILLSLVFIFFLFLKVESFNIYEARVTRMEDEYYVQVLVPLDKTIFLDDTRIILNKKTYNYKIINIDQNYIDYDGKKYMIVNIFIDLENKYLIENNYIVLKQKNQSKNLLTMIIERIKKGMNL